MEDSTKKNIIPTLNPITAIAHPSLALIKYWGKQKNTAPNIPATTSVAVTLDTLQSTVSISESTHAQSTFMLNNIAQSLETVQLLQKEILPEQSPLLQIPIEIQAHNNFPTAAGLASSSSGYAALVQGLSAFYKIQYNTQQLSTIARIGSGSASRSVYDGFTVWNTGSAYAKSLAPASHWKELRVLVAAPYLHEKHISSRQAMIHTQNTSPYFSSWHTYNDTLAVEAQHAILDKDLEKLGILIQSSYSAMHASMLASRPPVFYWNTKSIELINIANTLRAQGVPVWETMDAGPQVKFITLSPYIETIIHAVHNTIADIWLRVCAVGQGSRIV